MALEEQLSELAAETFLAVAIDSVGQADDGKRVEHHLLAEVHDYIGRIRRFKTCDEDYCAAKYCNYDGYNNTDYLTRSNAHKRTLQCYYEVEL